jgi:hypothetical protein
MILSRRRRADTLGVRRAEPEIPVDAIAPHA